MAAESPISDLFVINIHRKFFEIEYFLNIVSDYCHQMVIVDMSVIKECLRCRFQFDREQMKHFCEYTRESIRRARAVSFQFMRTNISYEFNLFLIPFYADLARGKFTSIFESKPKYVKMLFAYLTRTEDPKIPTAEELAETWFNYDLEMDKIFGYFPVDKIKEYIDRRRTPEILELGIPSIPIQQFALEISRYRVYNYLDFIDPKYHPLLLVLAITISSPYMIIEILKGRYYADQLGPKFLLNTGPLINYDLVLVTNFLIDYKVERRWSYRDGDEVPKKISPKLAHVILMESFRTGNLKIAKRMCRKLDKSDFTYELLEYSGWLAIFGNHLNIIDFLLRVAKKFLSHKQSNIFRRFLSQAAKNEGKTKVYDFIISLE